MSGVSQPEVIDGERVPHASGPPLPAAVAGMPQAVAVRQERYSFNAALTTFVPVLPFAATVAGVLIYLLPAQGSPLLTTIKSGPFLYGGLISLLVALVLALLRFQETSSARANSGAYTQLTERINDLRTELATVSIGTGWDLSQVMAADRVRVYVDLALAELGRAGPQWVLGTGYTTLSKLLNRAEELLLPLLPSDVLVNAALWDERRLQRLPIDDKADLLLRLRSAMVLIQPSVATMLGREVAALRYAAVDDGHDPLATPGHLQSARATIAQVRRAINDHLETRPDPLARIRALSSTLAATGLGTFLLATIVISNSGGVSPMGVADPIFGASMLFLAGAMVGLFNQLYNESNAQVAHEESGLTAARLTLTPVLSGLAAIAGVILLALLPSTINVPASAALQAGSSISGVPSFAFLFNVPANPLSIVLAGVFGLAPGRFLSVLQKADSGLVNGAG